MTDLAICDGIGKSKKALEKIRNLAVKSSMLWRNKRDREGVLLPEETARFSLWKDAETSLQKLAGLCPNAVASQLNEVLLKEAVKIANAPDEFGAVKIELPRCLAQFSRIVYDIKTLNPHNTWLLLNSLIDVIDALARADNMENEHPYNRSAFKLAITEFQAISEIGGSMDEKASNELKERLSSMGKKLKALRSKNANQKGGVYTEHAVRAARRYIALGQMVKHAINCVSQNGLPNYAHRPESGVRHHGAHHAP